MNIRSFSHIGSFFRSFLRPYPARDWFVVLVVAFFMFLAFAFYGVYVYFGIETGALFASGPNIKPAITITVADLTDTVGAYQNRTANWSAHTVAVPNVTDPAVPVK